MYVYIYIYIADSDDPLICEITDLRQGEKANEPFTYTSVEKLTN